MIDPEGNIHTSQEAIERLALLTYKTRLENRPMRKELLEIQKTKEDLCKVRLQAAQKNKTALWTLQQLEVVLKYLKKNKSCDPLGYVNGLFQPNVAGDDLKLAVVKLLNMIKFILMLWSCTTFPQFIKIRVAEMTSTTIAEYSGFPFLEPSLTG